MSLVRNPDPTVPSRWTVLFLLVFMEGCTVMGSGRTKPEPHAGEVLYIRREPQNRTDLWIQSLKSGRHRALTSSGTVSSGGGGLDPWRGAVISPDGKQVAYVELQSPEAPAGHRVGAWNALFVVNADGTGRRKLVDLTQVLVPEGQELRAGSFIWSDDGSRIAYVLASPPTRRASLRDCAHVTLHSVDVVSGRGATLSEARPLGSVALLGWYPARAEVVLYGECGYPEGPLVVPIPNGSVTVLRVSDRTARQRLALHPSLSPDGTFVFIPSHPRALAGPPTLYRTDALDVPPALTLELPVKNTQVVRITWLHHASAALISSTDWELPTEECVGTHPQPRVLFKLELETGTLQRVRKDAHALNVVAISPDDTHALVGIITGEDDRFYPPCVRRPVERLFLVRLDELASELPIQELLRRSRPLTTPRVWSDVNPFAEYVGWVR